MESWVSEGYSSAELASQEKAAELHLPGWEEAALESIIKHNKVRYCTRFAGIFCSRDLKTILYFDFKCEVQFSIVRLH